MRLETLTKNFEFGRCYKKGANFVHPLLVSYVLKTKRSGVRIGITATKKIGGAVQRNRARRIIRAAFTAVISPNAAGADIVFVARTACLKKKSTDLEAAVRAHLMEAGVAVK